jgi:hypothetical protein
MSYQEEMDMLDKSAIAMASVWVFLTLAFVFNNILATSRDAMDYWRWTSLIFIALAIIQLVRSFVFLFKSYI